MSEIPGFEKGIGVLKVDGRNICIVPLNGALHAFSENCPHAGVPLSEGDIDAKGIIRCPQHGACFNIQNGLNTTGEGYHLACWPVEEREDGIYVGFK